MESFNQRITIDFADVTFAIKREDLLHPFVSGNKFRKLKYNLTEAERLRKKTLLTFGGAFSNHIAAVAAAGKEYGFDTIGVIRGEELAASVKDNPTLAFAGENGMRFEFVSRSAYGQKTSLGRIAELHDKFGDFYLIPEGGTNELAVQGCEEILTDADSEFDYICCAVGTGGTISGLINSTHGCQQVLGFPALKGQFLDAEIRKFATNDRWLIVQGYEFGGYAKVDERLVRFINGFRQDHGVLLDPVYTGKMVFGVMDLIRQGFFGKGSRILAIHTGGLQGIAGMNQKLTQKSLPIIETHD